MGNVFTQLSKLRNENEDLIREVKYFKMKSAELEAKLSLVDSKFISGNSVPVDRVTITRSEWEAEQ